MSSKKKIKFMFSCLHVKKNNFIMKLAILWVGKTANDYTSKAIDTYVQRIGHYMPIEII